MATKAIERKVCDVYGTSKGVETYTIQLHRVVPSIVEGVEPSRETVLNLYIDLGQRGLDRLLKFVERGTRSLHYELVNTVADHHVGKKE